MKISEAAQLYKNLGRPVPRELADPREEHIRGTRKKSVGGIEFRSTLEAEAWQVLSLWLKAGRIELLERQPKFELQGRFQHEGKTIRVMTYKADFSFWREGRRHVIEAKGFRTQPYMMRRKLFLKRYGGIIKFHEWTRETLRSLR